MAYIRINGKLEPTSPQSNEYVNKNRMKIGLGIRDELKGKFFLKIKITDSTSII